MEFSTALRARRTHRHVSQLELATRAGTTQRHVSFLESGRSAPGRNLVIRLAESLELSLRERNDLLFAAGFAPAYPETPLRDAALAPVRRAIDHILTGHLPYPAIVIDGGGGLIAANTAFDLIAQGAAPELTGPGSNVYRLALHPDGIAPRVVNAAQWSRHVLERITRLEELHAELAEHVPHLDDSHDHLGFAVPLRLRSSHGELNLMTTVTMFATAVDITLNELKLEAFLPADDQTAMALRRFHEENCEPPATDHRPGNM
jgi:transcriptional regulator with XRE-family HTH domain